MSQHRLTPQEMDEPEKDLAAPRENKREPDNTEESPFCPRSSPLGYRERHTPHKGFASLVWGAKPGMLFQKNRDESFHPLELSWVFGYNSSLAVHSLMDGEERVLLYVSSHTVVIHDIPRNRQFHLQGHTNVISCLCVSEDKRWVATADQGPDALIIVWDSYSGIPVCTIFETQSEEGICAIAISQDAKYLVTISAATVQKVCVWRWTLPTEKAICSTELKPEFGYQDYVIFNPQNPHEFVSNSKTQVIFYLWDDSGLQYGAPFLSNQTFKCLVGQFSQSVFHFNNTQALTGTSAGKLVVWDMDNPRTLPEELPAKPHGITATKMVSMQKESLTVLQVLESPS